MKTEQEIRDEIKRLRKEADDAMDSTRDYPIDSKDRIEALALVHFNTAKIIAHMWDVRIEKLDEV